jgi:hypothetical protein
VAVSVGLKRPRSRSVRRLTRSSHALTRLRGRDVLSSASPPTKLERWRTSWRDWLSELRKLIEQNIEALKDSVAAGLLSDMQEYKKLTGQLRGLADGAGPARNGY